MTQANDLAAALEIAKRPDAVLNLAPSQRAYYRLQLEADPFLFAVNIVGYDKLVPRFHQPIAYLLGGCAEKLAWVLRSEMDSLVIQQIKSEFSRLGIDWLKTDPVSMADMRRRGMSAVDLRVFRGAFKTSTGVSTICWDITQDPNQTILLTSGVDDGAWAMCMEVGDIIKSRFYRSFFPDRIPEQEKVHITKDYILLAGRTVHRKEPCLEARGATSTSTGKHYDKFYTDDLNTEEMTEVEIANANRFLDKLRPLSFAGERGYPVYLHMGTRYSPHDDAAILSGNERYVHINVPIELHGRAIRPSDYMTPGTPTLPEVADEEKIAAIKRDTPNVLSFFRNQLLIADSDSATLFPPSVVDASASCYRRIVPDPGKPFRFFVVRQARDKNFHPIHVKGEQDIALDPRLPDAVQAQIRALPKRMVKLDPLQMRRVVAIDPSIELDGDECAGTLLAMDHDGIAYQLRTRSGHGWEDSMQLAVDLDEVGGGVRQIGIEKASGQNIIAGLLQRGEKHRRIKHKVALIPHNNVSKFIRIRDLVSTPLLTGRLLLDPDDIKTRDEMKKYRPSAKAVDNRLDSLAIGMSMLTKAAAPTAIVDARVRRAAQQRSIAPETGISTDSWVGEMWSVA